MTTRYRTINDSVIKIEDSPEDLVKEIIIKTLNHSEGKLICKLLKEKLPHLENVLIEKEND